MSASKKQKAILAAMKEYQESAEREGFFNPGSGPVDGDEFNVDWDSLRVDSTGLVKVRATHQVTEKEGTLYMRLRRDKYTGEMLIDAADFVGGGEA